MFAPLDMLLKSAPRSTDPLGFRCFHERVVKRMDKVDHLADEVERAATTLVGATRQPDTIIMPGI